MSKVLELEKNYSVIDEKVNKFMAAMGEDISDIINQDGDQRNDGEVIDEIVLYLTNFGIYKERK